MLLDLVVLGFGIQVILGAVKRGKAGDEVRRRTGRPEASHNCV